MNDNERLMWVNNDEYLYRQYMRARNKRTWLRENRGVIDVLADLTVKGKRRAHTGPLGRYLA